MKNVIKLEGLDLDTLAEIANEAGEQVEKHARNAVQVALTAGRALQAAKNQVPHGEWLKWLGTHWKYSQRTAINFIRLANFQISSAAANLNDAASVRDAMRIMLSDPEKPTQTRKTASVEVIEPAMPKIRKTGKGSEKTPEAAKPITQQVTPEIIDKPEDLDPVARCLASHTIADVVARWSSDLNPKHAATTLRKLADKLDPPTKFVPPDIQAVAEYCSERKNKVDPETFVAHYTANGWKLSNGNKMADWKSCVITWEKRNEISSKQSGRKALTGDDW